MTVKFYSPSYRRPQRSITQQIYPQVQLVVRESEADSYRENGNTVVTCPDAAQGNVARIRNYILDNLSADADCIVLMDDDCSGVKTWQKQKAYLLQHEELQEACEHWGQLCRDWGFHYWGVNCVPDKGAYREYTPFGTLQFIGGPFCAHLTSSSIRYDESLPLKEDYDISLQHIRTYGGCLRVNYAHYVVKQAEQVGGCATYRNRERERQQFFALQKKWGKDVIVRDKQSKRSFDFNPVLKVPIRGV